MLNENWLGKSVGICYFKICIILEKIEVFSLLHLNLRIVRNNVPNFPGREGSLNFEKMSVQFCRLISLDFRTVTLCHCSRMRQPGFVPNSTLVGKSMRT